MRKNIEFRWLGREVAAANNMDLTNTVEMSGVNIFWLHQQLCLPQYPPISILAIFYQLILKKANYKDDDKPVGFVDADFIMEQIADSEDTVYLVRNGLELLECLMPVLGKAKSSPKT